MNRIFTIVFLLVAVYSHAYTQQADQSINQTAQATELKKMETPLTVIGKENNNLYCSGYRSGSAFGIFFNLEISNKTICFAPGSRAIVIFTDLSKLQVVNSQSNNCKGNFFITGAYGTGSENDRSSILDNLGAKTIRAIRFYSTEGFIDYDVAEEDDLENTRKAEDFSKSLRKLQWTP